MGEKYGTLQYQRLPLNITREGVSTTETIEVPVYLVDIGKNVYTNVINGHVFEKRYQHRNEVLHTVILMRRITDCGLKEAVAITRFWQKQHNVLKESKWPRELKIE